MVINAARSGKAPDHGEQPILNVIVKLRESFRQISLKYLCGRLVMLRLMEILRKKNRHN